MPLALYLWFPCRIWKLSKFKLLSTLICKVPDFWKWKLCDQIFVLSDSGNTLRKVKNQAFLSYRVENQICLISWYVCVCACVGVLLPLLFSSRGGRMRALSTGCSLNDQSDFIDCTYFLVLTLRRKSAQIKPTTQISKTSH